ncbi:MAG: FG-GAP repeat domain-containing protein [Planctomycetaceae bacterium]
MTTPRLHVLRWAAMHEKHARGRRRQSGRRWWLFALGLASVVGGRTAVGQSSLEPLAYRNPGLVVDLGVGLWAWPIPCDADGDGDHDLVVSCPDKPSNGLWLFENVTGDTAADPLPVFRSGKRLGPTVLYVMPSYVDGRLHVLTPGTEHEQFLENGLSRRRSLGVHAGWFRPTGSQPKGPKVRHNQWRLADHDGDGLIDLVVGTEDWSHYGWDDGYDASGHWTHGPLHGLVHVFPGTGRTDEPFGDPMPLMAAGQPVDVFGCPSPNLADFDGDGDLDLLCGSFLDRCTYFRNVGSRTRPEYAAGVSPTIEGGLPLRMDLEMIVPVAFDWNRDGLVDLVVGQEDGRVAFVRHTGRFDDVGTPVFARPVFFRQEADRLKCGALATPCGTDWDGDGDCDILSGNTAGYIEFFENLSGPGMSPPRWAAPVRLEAGGEVFRVVAGPNGSIQGPAEEKWGYTTISVADWDGDGLRDILVNSILGEVVWLRNLGPPEGEAIVPSGSLTPMRLAAAAPIEVEWQTPQPRLAWGWRRPDGKPLLPQWRTTPVAHDFDGDGLVDLAMLDHEGYLAFFRRALVDGRRVLLHPRRAFLDEEGSQIRLTSGSAGASGRRKLCVVDWDGDGRFDLLVNSRNADLLRQIDSRDHSWRFERVGSLAERNIEGHDVSPAVVDFQGDGVPDFVGGAEDGRLYYMENASRRSSKRSGPREAVPQEQGPTSSG